MTIDLDDLAALQAADRDGTLVALATGAAQIRESVTLTAAAGVAELADDGRPRAVLVCGVGSSGIAGDLLAAAAGPGCPAPVVAHRGSGLPAWAGVADLVVAVDFTGSTPETLSALEEAVRRGSRLLVVGPADSPLQALGARGRAVFVPVRPDRSAQTSVWALAMPLVLAGHALGLLQAGASQVEKAAAMLEQVAVRCRPTADVAFNPAKTLAQELADTLPVLLGASSATGAVAYRFSCQLNQSAAVPATWGVLPEAAHNQVAAWGGRWVPARSSQEDFFRDRSDEPVARVLRVVLLRDRDEHPVAARSADAVSALAAELGLGVSSLRSEGDEPLARLASLIGLTDFAAAYLELLHGDEPAPIDTISALAPQLVR